MLASRLAVLSSPLRHLWRVVGRSPKTALVIGLVFFGLTGAAAGYFWLLPDYHFRAALRACKEDRLADAKQHLEWCLRLSPDHCNAHLLSARAHRMDGEYTEAEFHLGECKRIQGQATASTQLEWLLLRAQGGEVSRLEGGLVDLVDKKDPDAPWILETLAHCYLSRLNFHITHHYVQEWLKLEPDNIRALNWRGLARERMEYFEGAHDDCVRILELRPEHWEVRLRLVGYLLQGLKFEEVEEHLRVLRRDHGDNAEVRACWAEYLTFKGNMDEAKKTLDDLLAKNPADSRALYQRAKIELQAGTPEEAEKMFRRVIDLDKGNIEARYRLYSALERIPSRKHLAKAALADYQKAQRDAKKLTQVLEKMETFTDAASLVEAAEILGRGGSNDLARLFLLRAIGIDPGYRQAHVLLARYYEEQAARVKDIRERDQLKEKAASQRKILEQMSPKKK
jgi:tetratricopeptide (TPR) repeat protein